MSSSGTASSAVLLTVVAVGAAAGVAVRPNSEFVPPISTVHREAPGPAQIELVEAAAAGVSQLAAPAPPQEVTPFGVDVSSAISAACGEAKTADMLIAEAVVCDLIPQALQRIPTEASAFVPLFLGGNLPAR